MYTVVSRSEQKRNIPFFFFYNNVSGLHVLAMVYGTDYNGLQSLSICRLYVMSRLRANACLEQVCDTTTGKRIELAIHHLRSNRRGLR